MSASRRLAETLVREGAKIRRARRRRRWTQAELGRRVGLAQSTISQIERGQGGTLSLETWQRVADALELPLRLELGRDPNEKPVDAGHLAIQQLVVKLGCGSGYTASFELQSRAGDPARWTDVGLRSSTAPRLLLIECANVLGDIGAAFRSGDRKRAEAEAYAIAIGAGDPYTVHQCWVVKATRRNRALVARYADVFAARLPGSSRAWVQALSHGKLPPREPGLVWCDVNATRLFEWRR